MAECVPAHPQFCDQSTTAAGCCWTGVVAIGRGAQRLQRPRSCGPPRRASADVTVAALDVDARRALWGDWPARSSGPASASRPAGRSPAAPGAWRCAAGATAKPCYRCARRRGPPPRRAVPGDLLVPLCQPSSAGTRSAPAWKRADAPAAVGLVCLRPPPAAAREMCSTTPATSAVTGRPGRRRAALERVARLARRSWPASQPQARSRSSSTRCWAASPRLTRAPDDGGGGGLHERRPPSAAPAPIRPDSAAAWRGWRTSARGGPAGLSGGGSLRRTN